MPRRLLQLYLGLNAYGVSMVLMLQSQLGLMPWDVLHQGIALQGGWPMGRVAVATSFAVLLAWIPIRQRPGLGTISNPLMIGLVFDATMSLLGDVLSELGMASRIALLLGGIVLNGVALLIAARLVPGIHYQGSLVYLLIAGLVLGLINLIVGLIIIHLTPEDRPKRIARCDKCGQVQPE